MEQYSAEQFARSGRRVRSPISERRTRRLVRLATVCVIVMAGALVLLMVALG